MLVWFCHSVYIYSWLRCW